MSDTARHSERPVAIAVLLLANLIAIQFAPIALFRINGGGMAPWFLTIGLLLGQCVWLASGVLSPSCA